MGSGFERMIKASRGPRPNPERAGLDAGATIARTATRMDPSPKADLACLAEGSGYLLRRPAVSLGLAVLGMLLAALGPLLQAGFHLPKDEVTTALLGSVGVMPMMLYFLPRFIAEADAFRGGRPQNPHPEWQRHFDQRLLKALGAHFLLWTLVALFWALVIPSLLLLAAFGWAPTRVLLRGESLAEAARGSLRMMALGWRRAVLPVLAILGVLVLAGVGVAAAQQWELKATQGLVDPLLAIKRPLPWLMNFGTQFMSVWTTACLLAVFRRLESAAEPKPGIKS